MKANNTSDIEPIMRSATGKAVPSPVTELPSQVLNAGNRPMTREERRASIEAMKPKTFKHASKTWSMGQKLAENDPDDGYSDTSFPDLAEPHSEPQAPFSIRVRDTEKYLQRGIHPWEEPLLEDIRRYMCVIGFAGSGNTALSIYFALNTHSQ